MAIGIDRVQAIKRESSGDGGTDNQGGPFGEPAPINPQQDALEACGIYLQDESSRDYDVYLSRESGEIASRDTGSTTPSKILNIRKHGLLDTLLHSIDENHVTKAVFSGSSLTAVNVYVDDDETELIRKIELSYTGEDLSGVIVTQYSGGIWIEKLTGTIAYSGNEFSKISFVYEVAG